MHNRKRNCRRCVAGCDIGENPDKSTGRWERNFLLAVSAGVLFFAGLALYAAWKF